MNSKPTAQKADAEKAKLSDRFETAWIGALGKGEFMQAVREYPSIGADFGKIYDEIKALEAKDYEWCGKTKRYGFGTQFCHAFKGHEGPHWYSFDEEMIKTLQAEISSKEKLAAVRKKVEDLPTCAEVLDGITIDQVLKVIDEAEAAAPEAERETK